MDMQISFSDGDRVDVSFDGRTISTDQDGSAPAPFDLFLASIGACSGFYVERFCRQRGIPVDGIGLEQHVIRDPQSRMVERIEIEVCLPEGFPARYRDAVVRAAAQCPVKKHLEQPPRIEIAARQRAA